MNDPKWQKEIKEILEQSETNAFKIPARLIPPAGYVAYLVIQPDGTARYGIGLTPEQSADMFSHLAELENRTKALCAALDAHDQLREALERRVTACEVINIDHAAAIGQLQKKRSWWRRWRAR